MPPTKFDKKFHLQYIECSNSQLPSLNTHSLNFDLSPNLEPSIYPISSTLDLSILISVCWLPFRLEVPDHAVVCHPAFDLSAASVQGAVTESPIHLATAVVALAAIVALAVWFKEENRRWKWRSKKGRGGGERGKCKKEGEDTVDLSSGSLSLRV